MTPDFAAIAMQQRLLALQAAEARRLADAAPLAASLRAADVLDRAARVQAVVMMGLEDGRR